MYRGIFVDDQAAANVYAQILTTPDQKGIEVDFLKPDLNLEDLAAKILSEEPDIVMLDYRLDEDRQENDDKNRYKAGPLAQQLRDHSIDNPSKDLPIVLLSNEENIKKIFNPDKTAHDLFDVVFTKEHLSDNVAIVHQELLALIDGYFQAKQVVQSNDRLMQLLSLGDHERWVIEHRSLEEVERLVAPHLILGVILRDLVRRTGILLDKHDVLARLAVSKDSQHVDDLFSQLDERRIRYEGVMSSGWSRWWAHRLSDLSIILEMPELFSLGASQRVSRLNEKLDLTLSPAQSRWTGGIDALLMFACTSCRCPTEATSSVAAYDPYPYSFNDKMRICFSCIATGEYEERGLEIDERDEFIGEKIKSGNLRPPE